MNLLGGQIHWLSSSLAVLLVGSGAQAASCDAAGPGYSNSGAAPCITIEKTSFSGAVSNSGSVGPGGIAIRNATITGGIENTGTIAGGISIDSASRLDNPAGAALHIRGGLSGGIRNAGTIASGGGDGISIGQATSTFSGGIVNSGVISAHGAGILVTGAAVRGGITNSGTISAARGIVVSHVATFAGGITNSGSIGPGGITITNSTITGAIEDTGQIAGGIRIDGASTLSGGLHKGQR